MEEKTRKHYVLAASRFNTGDRVRLHTERMIGMCKREREKYGIHKGSTGTAELVPNKYYIKVVFDNGVVINAARPGNFDNLTQKV